MKTKWNWIIILALLFGLVFTGPKQTAFAATASADFTFTSSVNPSNHGQPVTFTLSATGSDPTYAPFGYVNFYDNGNLISGCSTLPLNLINPGAHPQAGVPVTCTTSTLSVGVHTITAEFSSLMPDVYANTTLTLAGGQTVTDAIALTIYPSELVDVMLTKPYSIPFTAYYPGGSECTTCNWYTTLGSLPDGIGLSGTSGVLQGTPTTVGTYTFTVVADDGNGAQGSQAFTWNVTKVKTVVRVGLNSTTYVGSTTPISLGAAASNPNPTYTPAPTGTISFSVNGVPVPGCSGTEAKTTNNDGAAYCTSYVPTGLAEGSYEIQADFTPDATSSTTYLSGSGTGTLQVTGPQAIVSGHVFFDDNQNKVWDAGEPAQGTWNVFLNQDCDGVLEGNVVTDNITGVYTYYPVPIDHTYCLYVDLSGYTGYVQTTPYNNLTLISGNQTYDIGVYFPHISIQPASGELPGGSVGAYYEQTFVITGGTPPYTIEPTSTLPAGLTFDKDTLILSGTPTAGGMGQLSLYVADSDGLTASSDYTLKIMADGDFTFTSSANPSALGEAVTFTVSATGEADTPYGKLPPTGIVTFFADETEIAGCSDLILNATLDADGNPIFGNYPATCTTDALGEGSHEIVAAYFDAFEVYNIPSLSLIQQVGVSISPATLPNAEYQTPYNQQLAASGGVEPYYFTLVSGSLPSGISLDDTGLLSGTADSPAVPGTYPITIQVVDSNGDTASTDYDFVLDKGVPTVTTKSDANISWHRPFSVSAEVLDINSYVLDGTVAFYIDDLPVPECGAVKEVNGFYLCENVSMDLAVRTLHTLKAVYTPTGLNAGYYTSGTGSSTFTVQPSLANFHGEVFLDADQDGELDTTESTISVYNWTVNLDQGCDGEVDYTQQTYAGYFNFADIPVSGQCHRITIESAPGYQQTTVLADFYPEPGTAPSIDVGFFYPTIIVSPSAPGTYTLPSGTIGVEYSQTFSASGGTGPYVYTATETLPGGLALSSDGILSGTPTQAGTFMFGVKAEDANGAIGIGSYSLTVERVKIDGDFTLTSSTNPSAPGEAVTFTVSATGNYETPDGVIPPVGLVTFLADGTEIVGCSNLYLNLLVDPINEPILGDYPVSCTTDALGEGSHEITATYLDLTDAYNQPSLSLTQVVNAPVSADLAIDMIDSKNPVKPGSKLTYTLTVSNLGPDAAEGITVADKLDVTTSFVSVSAPKGWSCDYAKNSGIVTCTSASLGSGSKAVIKITVMVDKTAKLGKDLVNTAQVTSTTFDPDLLNNSFTQKTLVAK